MNNRDAHIDFVHTDRPRVILEELNSLGKIHTFEFDGTNVEVQVFDFRPDQLKKMNQESIEKTPVTFYFTGFPQSEMANPHDLTGAIIEQARETGGILLIPRFKELPATANIEDEVLMSALGILQVEDNTIKNPETRGELKKINGILSRELLQDSISLDLSAQDVTLYGYSDGNRLLVQMCGKIDEIKLVAKSNGQVPERKLVSFSSTSIIDEARRDTKPTGKEHTKRFKRQVVWTAIEETRLRLNYLIDKEKRVFEEKFYQVMEEERVDENEEQIGRVRVEILTQKDKEGNDLFPLLKHGLEHIEDAEMALDPRTIRAVLTSVLRLNSFEVGNKIFREQLQDASKANLGMLYDVLQRGVTGKREYTYEELGQMRESRLWMLLWHGFRSTDAINAQFAHAEHRNDEICGTLSTFNVECIWPLEDLIAPEDAYGQTIRRIIAENYKESDEQLRASVEGEVLEEINICIEEEDDKQLGRIFIENAESMGFLLFPKAKSVRVQFVGRRGGMESTHSGLTKKADLFLKRAEQQNSN